MDGRREQVSPGGVDALFGRRGWGRGRGRRLRGGGCRRWRLGGRRRVRTVTATTGDRCRQPSQNRHTRHDTCQANSIRVFHHDISNRFGLIADSPQRPGREPLGARFIDAPVVVVVKLANSARSVFMSAAWKSNFTDLSTSLEVLLPCQHPERRWPLWLRGWPDEYRRRWGARVRAAPPLNPRRSGRSGAGCVGSLLRR